MGDHPGFSDAFLPNVFIPTIPHPPSKKLKNSPHPKAFIRCSGLFNNNNNKKKKTTLNLFWVCFRSLSGNNIKFVPEGVLQRSQGLALLELKGNPLIGVHPYAFASLPKLRKL